MTDPFSIDLTSSRQFQLWYLESLAGGTSPSELINSLSEIGSATATTRALSIAYWKKTPEYDALSKVCQTNGDKVAAEIAKGFFVFRRSIEILREGGGQMRTRIAEMRGALEWSQQVLEGFPQTDLVIEGQIGALCPLCLLLTQEGKHADAIRVASQALFLAEQLQAPVSIARARNILIACTANAGHITSTAEMVLEERRQVFRYDQLYTELELAAALFRLGNFAEATSIVETLIATHEDATQDRALDFLQRMKVFWGVGGMDGPLYPTPQGSPPTQWITETMREMLRAYATPRESKLAEVRAAHFAQVIEGCQSAVGTEAPWVRLYTQWATATAHMGRGEWANAAGIIEHAGRIDPEWLDIRILILGLGLELSLSWHAPDSFSSARYEHQLRKAFAQAAESRFASPEGLAQLLHRWHPTAAAYLALMPEPILACSLATQSVIKVGQHNQSFEDASLPPVLACELVLRALDFDLRRDFAFIQSDPGASRKKKKDLLQEYGEVELWRLPVSAIKIMYGLMSHQNQAYHDTARSVIQTYGIRPSTTALYPMIGILDRVEQYSKELLAGHMTPKGFAIKMSEIH